MSKILTNLLSKEEYGLYAMYTTLWVSIATIYYNPVGQGLIRYYPIMKQDGALSTLKDIFLYFLYKGVKVSFLVIVIVSPISYAYLGLQWTLVIFMAFLIAFLSGSVSISVGLFNSFDISKRTYSLLIELFDKSLLLLCCTTIAFLYPKSIYTVVAFLFSAFITTLVSSRLINKHIFPPKNENNVNFEKYKQEILRYSYPYSIWGVTTAIQIASERWSLGLYYSYEKVATYAIINLIGFQALNILFGMITSFVSPLIFQEDRSDANANTMIQRTIILFIAITIFIAFILYSWGEEIILLISTSKYLIPKINLLLLISCLSACVFNIAQVHSLKYMRSLNTKKLIPVHVVSSILGIILNIGFTYYGGILGLIIALLLVYILKLLIQILYWISIKKTI